MRAETAHWGRRVDEAQHAAHQAGEAYAAARDALDSAVDRRRSKPLPRPSAKLIHDLERDEREAYRAWRFAVSWLNELQCGE